jgi:ABC-type nitrate/sulfonate/bicarbonate transport system permease component
MATLTLPGRTHSATTRRPRRGGSSSKRGLLPIAIGLLAWQFLGNADSLSFPTPERWVRAIGDMYDTGSLLPALGVTLRTFALSLVAATVVGACVGALIGSSRMADRALSPTLDFVRTIPPPAIVPIAILLLGASLTMSTTVVVLTIVWPILLNTASAVRSVPPVRIDMSRTIGLSLRERLTKVVLPSLVPSIMIGIRVAVSISLVVTLLVDILGSGTGLGRIMVERQQLFDAAGVWGLLLIIGTLGYLLNSAFGWLESVLLRNYPR